MLLYGLVACPLNKSQISSLDFVINRFFMKLLNSTDTENIAENSSAFNFPVSPSLASLNCFLVKLGHCANSVIKPVLLNGLKIIILIKDVVLKQIIMLTIDSFVGSNLPPGSSDFAAYSI